MIWAGGVIICLPAIDDYARCFVCGIHLLTRKLHHRLPHRLPHTFWGNPTAECAGGNAHESQAQQEQRGKSESPTWINCKDKGNYSPTQPDGINGSPLSASGSRIKYVAPVLPRCGYIPANATKHICPSSSPDRFLISSVSVSSCVRPAQPGYCQMA